MLKAEGRWREDFAYHGQTLALELVRQQPPAPAYAWTLTDARVQIAGEAPTALRALRDAGLYGRLHALGHRLD